MGKDSKLSRSRNLFLILVSLTATAPLLWIVSLSMRTQQEFAARPFGAPESLYLENYTRVLTDARMLQFIFNSIYVTFWAVVLVFIASTLAGYALARIRFRGAHALFLLFILSDAIPVFVVLIPLYILIQKIGLADSRWALILTYAAMKVGLSVFIMRGFFRSVSTAMEDAAQLDGCNLWQTIWHVMLPLVRPGALVVVILNFLSFWNEYFLAAVLLPNQELFTLPAGLAAVFMGRYATNWPVLATGIFISVLPSLGIFALAQDKIIEGWTVSLK